MTQIILMPALSPTMEEGTLSSWRVKEGDTIEAGDVIAEIETDKATMEFEAVDEGVVGKFLVPAGTEDIKVNTPIAILLEENEGEKELAEALSSNKNISEVNVALPQEENIVAPSTTASSSLPDEAELILMPALSPTMEEGTLSSWRVQEGDTIEAGAVIAEIETDKATMEFEAVDEGIIGKILIPAGTEGVKVNDEIAILMPTDSSTESLEQAKNYTKGTSSSNTQVPTTTTVEETKPTTTLQQPATVVDQSNSIMPDDEKGTGTMTVREALNHSLDTILANDEKTYIIGEEVAQYNGAYKITKGLLDKYGPDRVIDSPITEHGFAGLAIGSAFKGLKPIVEFMTANFAMQAIDQIINSAAKTYHMSGGLVNVPIVFRAPNGAAARVGAQHSQDYSSWYANVPGMKVIAPYSATDCLGLMRAAVNDKNPVFVLENELLYGKKFENVPTDDDFSIPIGKAKIERLGKHVTIVAYSIMVGKALDAAETLAKEGIEVEVINLRSLKPIDMPTILSSVKKTGNLVVAEEGWKWASLGSTIITEVTKELFEYLYSPAQIVNSIDSPIPYNSRLEQEVLPQIEDIIKAVKLCTEFTSSTGIEEIDNSKVNASSLAKRIAFNHKIDLSQLSSGSGPRGRILKVDVEQAIQNGYPTKNISSLPNTTIAKQEATSLTQPKTASSGKSNMDTSLFPSYEILPLNQMRKTIASRLSESKQTIPHFYVSQDIELDSLLKLRKQLNSNNDVKISVNDLVIKACAVALKQMPILNSAWDGNQVLQFEHIDISVAVSIEGGLITPVVRNASDKGLKQISSEMKDLAKRAGEGKLSTNEFMGGTFTISNMGMMNVPNFAAIINPPQSSILAIGAGKPKAIVRDGEVTIATVMNITLSCDHRIVDGSDGAKFVNKVKEILETPTNLLL